jgi:hypothetical protein
MPKPLYRRRPGIKARMRRWHKRAAGTGAAADPGNSPLVCSKARDNGVGMREEDLAMVSVSSLLAHRTAPTAATNPDIPFSLPEARCAGSCKVLVVRLAETATPRTLDPNAARSSKEFA